MPSLANLKDNVTQAAEEIRRLHAENQQLTQSLQTLWANTSDTASTEPVRGATVSFTEDREQLRERLRHYIAIIDRHLEQSAS